MLWENRQSNYDKYPKIKIKEIDELSSEAYEGYADIVNVLNLIEGEEAIVTSPENLFAPFDVHYAETFIIPENIKEYTIAPYGKSKGQKIATLKAYVRV